MKITEHITTTILLKLKLIKKQLENNEKEEALSGVNSIIENIDRFGSNGPESKSKAK
jgi:hypothetical protein|tara:strand:+ start:3765 stop:3935 length:171 start_codon:yes stop_codon:yes gene_type:complete